jgi:hypothetical protein
MGAKQSTASVKRRQELARSADIRSTWNVHVSGVSQRNETPKGRSGFIQSSARDNDP